MISGRTQRRSADRCPRRGNRTLLGSATGRAGALQLYALALVLSIVLGGTQALSRSLFSGLIPRGKEAEYYSLYEISSLGNSALVPLLFGVTLQNTGSYRAAIISLVVFFVVGLALLLGVNVRNASVAAGNTPPANVGGPRARPAHHARVVGLVTASVGGHV